MYDEASKADHSIFEADHSRKIEKPLHATNKWEMTEREKKTPEKKKIKKKATNLAEGILTYYFASLVLVTLKLRKF